MPTKKKPVKAAKTVKKAVPKTITARTTVKPAAKTVTKRAKPPLKSLALKGEKRILTHAAWKRNLIKKRAKKAS